MVGGGGQGLNSDNTLQDYGGFIIVSGGWDDPRAIDEIDPPGEGDVFPDLVMVSNLECPENNSKSAPWFLLVRGQPCRPFHSSAC